jgi:hypothetical protein
VPFRPGHEPSKSRREGKLLGHEGKLVAYEGKLLEYGGKLLEYEGKLLVHAPILFARKGKRPGHVPFERLPGPSLSRHEPMGSSRDGNKMKKEQGAIPKLPF